MNVLKHENYNETILCLIKVYHTCCFDFSGAMTRTRIRGTRTVLGRVVTVIEMAMTAIRTVVTETVVTATDPGTATGIVTKMTTTETARDYEVKQTRKLSDK